MHSNILLLYLCDLSDAEQIDYYMECTNGNAGKREYTVYIEC